MHKTNHDANIVLKPWGYEYLIYENELVAIWVLFINQNQITSLHCHSKKTTGLIVLDGECEISFIEDSKRLRTLDKIMIRKGLFHSTKAISENGAVLFEIETPNDKEDLVRLKDNYGRQGQPYENSTFHKPKEQNSLWFTDEEVKVEFANCLLEIHKVNNIDFFQKFSKHQNFIFLRGGIVSENNQFVAGPGDIAKKTTIDELTKVFKNISPETFVMIIYKDENK